MNYEEYKKELEGSTLGRDQLDKALGQNNIEVSDSPKRSFDQYIEQLSQSQLSRDKFDALLKKMRITYSVNKYDDYSYAVINGFRGSKSDFNAQEETKYVSKILNGADKTAETLKKGILEVGARLTEVQEAQKTLKSMPKEVLTLVKGEIDTIESKQKDYNNKTIQNLGKKADKEHKHRATEIIGLETIVRGIEDKIEDRPTRDEVSEVLDKKFITKDNTYSKEETRQVIKDKLKEIVIPGNGGGSSSGGGVQSVVAGTNITVDNTDPLNPIVNAIGDGTGDVTGPASSTDNAITRFDSTTGKVIQNSTVILEDDGDITGVNSLGFDTTPSAHTLLEGELMWNATDGTLDLGMNGGDIKLQIGQESFIKVRNSTGATLTNGTVIYFNGSLGNRPTIQKARSDVSATSMIEGILTEDIPNNTDGFITTAGYVRQIKTNYTGSGIWGTTWVEGDLLYVSKTDAGVLTNIQPSAPHHSDIVGTAGVIGAAGIGSILVNITRHKTLEDLSDVNGTALTTTGQIPVRNQTLGYFDFTSNITDYQVTSQKVTSLSSPNDNDYPTTQAVSTAINNAVTGLLDYRGTYDASSNLYPSTGGSGLVGVVAKGDFWMVSTPGTLGGTAVTNGDLIIALVDTPGQTSSNWDIVSNEIGYTPENVANKATTMTGNTASNTLYLSAKAIYDWSISTFAGISGSISQAFSASTIELGHATDTTISRSSAGVIAVEGVVVPTISSTSTLTNKTLALGSNTVSGTKAQFDTACTDDNFAFLGQANTFTASQTISSGTLNMPGSITTDGQINLKNNATEDTYLTMPLATNTMRLKGSTGKLSFHSDSGFGNVLALYTNGTVEIGSQNRTSGWTSWTPTVSGSSGSAGAYSYQTGKYKQIGKSCTITFLIVVAKNTLAGNISLALPLANNFTYQSVYVTLGDSGSTTKYHQGEISSGQLNIQKALATNYYQYSDMGSTIVLSGTFTYETT